MTKKSKIPLPLTGGCQCGNVRYQICESPITLYVCHCTECQRQSSAGFSRQFKHSRKPGKVTVPGKLSDDLPPGTLKSILRQAGLES
ncbi:MAG: type II toxin-antitoxin system HicA family toxin [Deltaproteobacteria bacterium]|nr:type II toxin-antitoxin system HicA family toxin [Deltaproteobacteria bacterium]